MNNLDISDGEAMALIKELGLKLYRCNNKFWEDRYGVWTVRIEKGDWYFEIASRDLNFAIAKCAEAVFPSEKWVHDD